MPQPGKLFVVSTPVGNLSDMTSRAVEVLKTSGLVIAEDTRVTGNLFSHFDIHSPIISCHKFNEKSRTVEIIERINNGTDVALVSDAGTPLMSDPGYVVVKAVIEAGLDVIAVPGASALLAAAVVSGFDPGRFLFYGFLEKKDGAAKKEIETIGKLPYPAVIYEAPSRIVKTLEHIAQVLPGRQVAVSKEITKLYERTFRGNPSEIAAKLTGDLLKGEFVIVLGPADVKAQEEDNEIMAVKYMAELIEQGKSKSEAAKIAAAEYNVSKNGLYKKAHEA
ncbi:MAG: 16S rRNA (cytidine(1402)-2'-O)-methyltransferase [Candidatus Goldbacteria bacterium]|nr:16S rRNA (cytidine(1402)-2'-O)-methyltransferase [Candidatus Goldiibacteriota bacterium]